MIFVELPLILLLFELFAFIFELLIAESVVVFIEVIGCCETFNVVGISGLIGMTIAVAI